MIVRELLTRVGYQVDRRSEDRAKDSFGKLRKAATALGTLFATGVVAQGFRRMIDAASDVEETMNVVTTAFEDQTNAVLQWARESGEASGRSEFAMREYAAQLGAVVGPTLGSAEATADLSTNLAQLAVDLGSFFNATDEEALGALRAGLIGSSEPLLRFGVNMKVASLEAFALEQGINKAFKEMTEAEQTMLRFEFIMDRTVKAQGDAAKTSGGFANQTKRLQGQLLSLAVAMGKTLLPGATDILQTFNALLKTIAGPLVQAFQVLTNSLRFVGLLLKNTVDAWLEFGTVGRTILAGLLAATILFLAPWLIMPLAIGAAIAAVLVLVDDLWKGLSQGEGVFAGLLQEFQFWLDETGSGLEAFGQILKTAVNFWGELITGNRDVWGTLGAFLLDSWQRWGDAIGGLGDRIGLVFRELVDVIDDIANAVTRFFDSGIAKIVDLIPRVGGILGDLDAFTGSAAAQFPTQIAAPGSPLAARGDVNARQEITVNVNATGADGAEVAAAVAPAVGRAAGDANRRTAQQLLVGGAS